MLIKPRITVFQTTANNLQQQQQQQNFLFTKVNLVLWQIATTTLKVFNCRCCFFFLLLFLFISYCFSIKNAPNNLISAKIDNKFYQKNTIYQIAVLVLWSCCEIMVFVAWRIMHRSS